MSSPLKREALVDVIERCAWLAEYYERSGVAPQSLDILKSTMYKAMIDLQVLSTPAISKLHPFGTCDHDPVGQFTAPTKSALDSSREVI